MILLINSSKTGGPQIKSGNDPKSSIPSLRRALRSLNLSFYEVRGPKIDPKVMDPADSIFKNITGVIISGSSLKLSKMGTDISKYVYILHYLRLFQHVPVLGICFGAQLLLMLYGGIVVDNHVYTEKNVAIQIIPSHKLFRMNKIKKQLQFDLDKNKKSNSVNKNEITVSFIFSDIPVITNRRIKPIAWVIGNTASLPVAYEFERGRVYGCLFHPELNPDTYYILNNVFGGGFGF
jgi:GMP synthase-like glutamine amidotransferase